MRIAAIPLHPPAEQADPRIRVEMPGGGVILGVGVENTPVVRVLVVDEEESTHLRKLVVLRTGQQFPLDEHLGTYLGTVYTESGQASDSPPWKNAGSFGDSYSLHVFDQGWAP